MIEFCAGIVTAIVAPKLLKWALRWVLKWVLGNFSPISYSSLGDTRTGFMDSQKFEDWWINGGFGVDFICRFGDRLTEILEPILRKKGVLESSDGKSSTYISEQQSIVGVRCPVGHVADSDSNMDTWELMRFRGEV